jgi:hypothetical protein
MKKTLFGFGLAISLFAFVNFADAATLILSPSSGTFTAGQSFNVNINLDTTGQTVDGVDLYSLHFNPAILQVNDANASASGVQITPGTLLSQTLTNTVNNTSGTIIFSQVTTGGVHYTGSGILATISFRAVANGTSAVSFDFTPGSTADTNAAGGGTDRLTSVTNGSFTVTGGVNPPPTPPTPPPPPPGTGVVVTADHYPSGTIFKYASNPTVYIKEGTIARPITDWSVYLNQVPASRSIVVIPSYVTFTNGPVLGLRNATLIKASNNPTVYLIIDGKKFAFTSAQEFYDHNYNFSNVYSIDDVNLVNAIPMSTDTWIRPVGTLFKYANSPAVYFLNSARLKRGYTTIGMFNIWNATLKDVITIPASETYPDGPIATLPNGIVVKGSASTTYMVYDGQLRPFSGTDLFTAMGFTNAHVKTFTDPDIQLHAIGSAMQ